MVCSGEKMEHQELVYKNARNVAQKALGNNLNSALELQMRRDNTRLYLIWSLKSDITIAVKFKLWKVVDRPHFLYNAEATIYLTKKVYQLDSLQRRQLRSILGVRYSANMSNEEVYSGSRTSLIYLGHLFRRERFLPTCNVRTREGCHRKHDACYQQTVKNKLALRVWMHRRAFFINYIMLYFMLDR